MKTRHWKKHVGGLLSLCFCAALEVHAQQRGGGPGGFGGFGGFGGSSVAYHGGRANGDRFGRQSVVRFIVRFVTQSHAEHFGRRGSAVGDSR